MFSSRPRFSIPVALLLASWMGCKSASDAGSGGGKGTGSGGTTGTGSGGNSGASSGGTTGSSGGTGGSATGGAPSQTGGATMATGSGGGSGGGTPGTGGLTATGGVSGTGDASGSGGDMSSNQDAAVTDAACQMASYTFAPTTPTVYVAVDRSGSMFDCQSTTTVESSCPTQSDTSWVKLRDAALPVIMGLQSQVRFGFAALTGTDPAHGGTCPMIDQIDPALNNYDSISQLYKSLPFQADTNQQGKKFESPTRQPLDMLGAKLLADTTPGSKFIVFVTDGQPDYCDDSNVLCAPDSVIGGLQALYTKGITTIIIGLQSKMNNLPAGTLQAYANAGAGEPAVMPLPQGGDMNSIWDQCQNIAPWLADLTTTGKTQVRGTTVGTYATMAGPTKPYTPDAADQAMLTAQLMQALSGVKSCSFDLGNINGQTIKVDLNQLATAHVCLGKTCPGSNEVPQDATNGWSMSSATELTLNGTACTTWRKPSTSDISFDFPCKSIIFE
jgi:hypothetical protein